MTDLSLDPSEQELESYRLGFMAGLEYSGPNYENTLANLTAGHYKGYELCYVTGIVDGFEAANTITYYEYNFTVPIKKIMEEINLEPTAEEEADYCDGFLFGLDRILDRTELLEKSQSYLVGYKAGAGYRIIDEWNKRMNR